jgi:hypothetical protein
MEFHEKLSRESYLQLKARLKGRAVMSRALREEACRNRGELRSNIRGMRSSMRWQTRLLLLGLAALKGRKTYQDIEENTAHMPLSGEVLNAIRPFVRWDYKETELTKDINKFFVKRQS